MQKQFRFFALMIGLFISQSIFAQPSGTPRPNQYKIGVDSVAMWAIRPLAVDSLNGRFTMATHKTNGTKIMVVLREGKIAQVGYQPKGGTFIARPLNSSPCGAGVICPTYQLKRCFFLPWGTCVCICGTWITAG